MSEQRKSITHPTWCDREACTAPEFRMTNEEYQQTRTHDAPRHKSRVLVMDQHRQDAGLFVFLEQLCAPWDCSTFLRFQVGKGAFAETFSTEVGDAGPAMGFAVFELLAEEIASQTRQYPSLYEERFGWVADHQYGDADQVAGVDPDMFPEFPAEDVWQDAPAPDPAALKPQDVEAPAQDVVVSEALKDAPAPDPATRVLGGPLVPWDAPCDCGAVEDPDGETMCTCTAQRAAAAAEDDQEAAELAEQDDETRADGPAVQLHVNDAVVVRGTILEVRAAVAERVTEWLATDPDNLAADAGMLNRSFNDGTVYDAVTEWGEWSTLFGATARTPVRIRVTREA